MKIKLLFAIILFTLCNGLSAQKNVNVDNLRFSYKERFMPTSPRDPMFFYYATKIEAPNSVSKYVDIETLYNKLFIDGQRVTDEPTDNDYIITVQLEPVEILESQVKERVVETKDKEGKVRRTYYYWVQVSYTFAGQVLFTKGDETIRKAILGSRNSTLTYNSKEYGNRSSAADHWNDNRENLKEKFTKDCVTKAINDITIAFSNSYGFTIKQTPGLIKTINEKKHPENEKLRAMSDLLKTRMQTLDGTKALEEEEMSDIIDYFKAIPEQYTDPKLKADVRLRYVAYYNLCRIYIYLDQPEKVKEYADLLFENGHDKKDAERLTKDADTLQERLSNSYFKRSQFDTEKYFEE